MKLTDKQREKLEEKLTHLLGGCDCPDTSKTCLYWKVVDHTVAEGVAAIVREVEKL